MSRQLIDEYRTYELEYLDANCDTSDEYTYDEDGCRSRSDTIRTEESEVKNSLTNQIILRILIFFFFLKHEAIV